MNLYFMESFRREGEYSGSSSEKERQKQLLREAELDAERAKNSISNNQQDADIRERYREALQNEGPSVQKKIQREFAGSHNKASMPMDFTEIDLEIKFFKESVTVGQLDLLEALKHQRHVGAKGNDRKIEKLEKVLREKRMRLEERKRELLKDAAESFQGYETGQTKGNVDAANELGSTIGKINNVLEM